MALSFELGNSRLTAVLLFIIALILVYLLGFHWFILRHMEYSEEISELSEQLGRFQRVAAHREQGLPCGMASRPILFTGGCASMRQRRCSCMRRSCLWSSQLIDWPRPLV